MGKLTNLNPATPIADADIPATIARDTETVAAIDAHLVATNPHTQYVNLTSDQINIGGTKTFTADRGIRIQGFYPGFWLDEVDTPNKGVYIGLNNGLIQMQRRANNFGGFEAFFFTLNITSGNAVFNGSFSATEVQVAETKVLGAREIGWTAPTGTPNKGAFASDTATLLEVSRRLFSLESALRSHGLLGV